MDYKTSFKPNNNNQQKDASKPIKPNNAINNKTNISNSRVMK